MVEQLLTTGDFAALGALAAGFAVFMLILALASYIYFALVYFTLARKLNTEPAWLAWVPIANIYLVWKMSGAPTWSIILLVVGIFASIIPFIGWILAFAPMAMMIFWMWLIAEKRKYPGWISLLLLIPIANFVVPGVIAWVDRK